MKQGKRSNRLLCQQQAGFHKTAHCGQIFTLQQIIVIFSYLIETVQAYMISHQITIMFNSVDRHSEWYSDVMILCTRFQMIRSFYFDSGCRSLRVNSTVGERLQVISESDKVVCCHHYLWLLLTGSLGKLWKQQIKFKWLWEKLEFPDNMVLTGDGSSVTNPNWFTASLESHGTYINAEETKSMKSGQAVNCLLKGWGTSTMRKCSNHLLVTLTKIVTITKILKHALVTETQLLNRIRSIWWQDSGTANQDVIMWNNRIGYPAQQYGNGNMVLSQKSTNCHTSITLVGQECWSQHERTKGEMNVTEATGRDKLETAVKQRRLC